MLLNCNCLDELKRMKDQSIDLIITEPPYGYTSLDFDKAYFNEEEFFSECYRVLKNNSFIVFTGYGDSFYRWNLICEKIGFKFKEAPIWNKVSCSNSLNKMPRQYENIAIRVKGKKTLNKVRIDYIDEALKTESYLRLINTSKRIDSVCKSKPNLIAKYIDEGLITYDQPNKEGYGVSGAVKLKADRGVESVKTLINGKVLTTLITVAGDSHYTSIHPTQKPVNLLEYLIKTYTKEGDLVLDNCLGSGSTAIACINTTRNFIGYELNEEYYKLSKERLEGVLAK